MFYQIFRHFGDVFDESRIDFCDGISDRFIGYLIEIHRTIVRVHNDFYRVADIVDKSGFIQLI